jgi:hypothetical protein
LDDFENEALAETRADINPAAHHPMERVHDLRERFFLHHISFGAARKPQRVQRFVVHRHYQDGKAGLFREHQLDKFDAVCPGREISAMTPSGCSWRIDSSARWALSASPQIAKFPSSASNRESPCR